MTIDEAFQFVLLCAGKDFRGALKPSDFNRLAPIAQIEAISDRIGNVKRLNGRLVPQYGYKANRKIVSELRLYLEGPVDLPVVGGEASYPNGYFYPDAMFTPDYKRIEMIDSDEYPAVKHSLIYPPDAEHPYAVFYGDYILIDPADTQVKFTYIKYPPDPVWAYTGTINPVYDPDNSQDFTGDRSLHLEICRKILKYVGVHLDADHLTTFAKLEEQTGA